MLVSALGTVTFLRSYLSRLVAVGYRLVTEIGAWLAPIRARKPECISNNSWTMSWLATDGPRDRKGTIHHSRQELLKLADVDHVRITS
jgi:hypothetical protein